LCSLLDSSSPDVSIMARDTELAGIYNRLQFFVRLETPAASGGNAVTLTGLTAMKAIKSGLDDVSATGGTVTKTDVQELESFMFLVGADDVAGFTTTIGLAEADHSARLRKAATKAKAKCKDKAVLEAMAMFT
jgi:hypothetical protein